MRILILGGAGLMGAGTIRDLLSPLSSGVTEVVAVDSSQERLDKLALDDPRLRRQVLDVADPAAVMAALAECDLCINAVPTFAGYQMSLFEACLEAGRTYVDYGGMGVYTVQQKALHDRFLSRGVTAVIGLGADPGLSNILCRACADRLDEVDKINLYWTATRLGPESPVLEPPYSLSTVLSEYSNPSQQFLDGALREVPARGGVEVLELPLPWGPTTFMFSQHSEPLTVPFAQGIAEKGIREFTWRLALPQRDQEAWIGLVRAGFGDFDTPVSVPGGTAEGGSPPACSPLDRATTICVVKPLDVLQAVIQRNIAAHRDQIPEQEGHEIHLAVGVGRRNGQATTVSARVIGRPDARFNGYVDAATSMNMSIAVQQILDAPLRPGVWAAEEYFDPARYLPEVRRRGFEVSIETKSVEAG